MTRIRNIICAALLAAIVLSCEQPFKVGLGPKEDITPPQFDVNSITPKSGAYLGKEVTIEGVASDDLGVQKVEVSFDGQSWSPVTSFDKATGEWSYEFDSEEYPDGNLSLQFRVTDNSGKSTPTPEMSYVVKNNPPTLEVQIPRPATQAGSAGGLLVLDNNPAGGPPEVVTNNYIMGVYSDLAGVAKDYPQIKFWNANLPEPTQYNQNAGWENVPTYAKDPGEGWVLVDDGLVEAEKGERGNSLRYYLRLRAENGEPLPEDANRALPVGNYRLKIRARDINGIPVVWPTDVYENKPEYAVVELIGSGIPPAITISPKMVHNVYEWANRFS